MIWAGWPLCDTEEGKTISLMNSGVSAQNKGVLQGEDSPEEKTQGCWE